MDNVLIYLKSFFSGNTRTIKVKQNILVSFLVKCCSIIISLLLVPLTLNYLNSYEMTGFIGCQNFSFEML